MAREEYIRIYRSDVGGATPSLTSGEIATNLVDGKFFIGGTNGSLITFTSNSYNVTSVNGLTGAVVSIATTGSNVFTGLNTFNVGIIAAGATFTGDIALQGVYDEGSQTTNKTTLTVVNPTANRTISLPDASGTVALTNATVASINGLTGTVTLTGDGSALFGYANNRIGARLGSYTLTGVASFDPRFFGIGTSGHLVLTGSYQVTGDTVQAGTFINIGTGKTINNIGVQTFNGLTGAVSLTGDGSAVVGKENNKVTVRLTTAAGATGIASFRNTHFLVDGTGHVQLAAAYQVTGDTVQAGTFINIGAGKTINNIGVQTFNSLTGAVSFTVPLATTSLTGTASFNPNRFQVSITGNVDLIAAYQATGDTIQAGSAINIGAGKVINNIGVTGIGFGADVGLTGKINLTAGTGITITRSGNTITFNGSTATVVTGDSGAIQGKLNTTITARPTTSVIVTNNGIPLGAPGAGTSLASYSGYGEGSNVHGETGVGYFDIAHFVVKPQYGLVQLRPQGFVGGGEYGTFSKQFTGLGASSASDGSLAYLYFDIGNLTFNDATTIDPNDDFVLFYDSSETGLVKTKRIRSDKILLDNDGVFNSKTSQLVKSKSVSKIEFEIVLGAVAVADQGLVKGASAFSYITQNTVKSINGATGDVMVVGNINGCTGAIVITGTTNEVMVTNSCPNITIGLPDNVSIPYLSGTGATFTQTVTATRFIGIVSGGDF